MATFHALQVGSEEIMMSDQYLYFTFTIVAVNVLKALEITTFISSDETDQESRDITHTTSAQRFQIVAPNTTSIHYLPSRTDRCVD